MWSFCVLSQCVLQTYSYMHLLAVRMETFPGLQGGKAHSDTILEVHTYAMPSAART